MDSSQAFEPVRASAALIRTGLANGLMLHYTAAADQTSLCRAIELYREAIASTPDDHPDRIGWLGNMSIALTSRHQSTGEHADLTHPSTSRLMLHGDAQRPLTVAEYPGCASTTPSWPTSRPAGPRAPDPSSPTR